LVGQNPGSLLQHETLFDVRVGSMLLKKDYEAGLLATLIQDQEQMRNHDSRNHLPGFVRFNF
jgi:hypothetical protein